MEYTASLGNLIIYVSHRRAECTYFVVQVNACVLHNFVAHVSPHVHIRVFHVYTAYVWHKSAQKFG